MPLCIALLALGSWAGKSCVKQRKVPRKQMKDNYIYKDMKVRVLEFVGVLLQSLALSLRLRSTVDLVIQRFDSADGRAPILRVSRSSVERKRVATALSGPVWFKCFCDI